MANRKMTSVEEVPLVGGRLCLDFVNTTGARCSEEPRERLHGYGDLLVWARRAELLTKEEAAELKVAAERRAEKARATLERALRIRATLYDALGPLAERRPPEAEDLSALDTLFTEAVDRRSLRLGREGVEWSWSRGPDDLGWFLWPIVHSAERVLTDEDPSRLKRCGADCDWLFLDETRNRSRRWCKKLCGDRMRARRYYRRRSQE